MKSEGERDGERGRERTSADPGGGLGNAAGSARRGVQVQAMPKLRGRMVTTYESMA